MDTIIVINPDFDDAIDTIIPGGTAFIYGYEMLDTEQGYMPCAWEGDTLIILNMQGTSITSSIRGEGQWSYTVNGGNERTQTCIFTVTSEDF